MSDKKHLLSLKASNTENFPILKYFIESLCLKPTSWQEWRNKVNDSIIIYDDGEKLNYKFKYENHFDLFSFSNLSDIINFSSAILILKKNNKIKLWILCKDNAIRYFKYEDCWKSYHIFFEKPSLVFNVVGIILGYKDNLPNYFADQYLILTSPYDDIDEEAKNNFDSFFKEMEEITWQL